MYPCNADVASTIRAKERVAILDCALHVDRADSHAEYVCSGNRWFIITRQFSSHFPSISADSHIWGMPSLQRLPAAATLCLAVWLRPLGPPGYRLAGSRLPDNPRRYPRSFVSLLPKSSRAKRPATAHHYTLQSTPLLKQTGPQ